ncbi:DUF992 domain-containing protein [Aquibium carbonis]|uniref:DUF992 domain-containing protein n=1 Tax=Aquibium carbonis TaxID=2495581 RepID=A0A429Z0S2_9HYPH|nr:DUF992 domain-containing protein [Aquibium carbonis]RST87293.1 DUF992 domain-containing protein [Aquibium carbonis]
MKLHLAASAALIAATASFAHAADAPLYRDAGPSGGVRIGVLDCQIGGGIGYVLGSAKELDCVFKPSGRGVSDNYAGTIRKLGVDLGFTTRGRLVWAVFAPTAGYHSGSLGGRYRGATVEATAGVGVGANVMVGGTTGSVHLQLVSVTGQTGLNLAATGTSVTLTAAN